MERILDINIWSLYRRIYYQLNTTSISDRLQRYVDKMTSITTLPSNPREGTKAVLFSVKFLRVTVYRYTEKVDPNYNAYRRQKWSIKRCIGHKCVCVYGAGCWLVALKSWYLYFLPDTPVRQRPRLVWRREWNATESPRFVHSSRPIGHGLASILVQDLHARS